MIDYLKLAAQIRRQTTSMDILNLCNEVERLTLAAREPVTVETKKPPFDKKDYQRRLMQARRAKQKAETKT